MSWSEATVEIAKYLAASGVVGVAGVLISTHLNQRHDLRKEALLESRLRERDWREFQKSTLVELQDIIWELLETVFEVESEGDLIRLGAKHVLSLQETTARAKQKLRRVEVLTARLEDDAIRDICERLRSSAYSAFMLVDDPSKAKDMEARLAVFTKDYNEEFRPEVRRVLKGLIVRDESDILTT